MNIYESITAIMGEGYSIAKEKTNVQQKFKYRGIDDVMNTFYPLLAKYKVFCVPEVLEQSREERESKSGGNLLFSVLKIKYTFYAEDGTNVSAVVIGEGMDSGDKASNKALAVGMKYALFQTFCIPTEEFKDPDETTPEPSKPVQKPKEQQQFICADCGKPISDYRNSKGNVSLTAKDIAFRSMDAYGRKLCMECSKAARMAIARAQGELEEVNEDNGGRVEGREANADNE